MKIPSTLKLLICVVFILLSNCSKKEDIPQDVQVNDFVWGGLNAFYKWQSNIPELSDKRFSSRSQLNTYLAGYNSPENLFESLLYQKGSVDKFSWIVDDYVALENSFKGIRLTSGMKLKGADFNNNNGFYVYVTNVVKGSDADAKGVKRGMIITQVNGKLITQSNVNNLFSGNSFTIHLADYNNGNPVENGVTIDLMKTNIQENPIKVAKVINSGTKKIGYLLYNQFSSSYDSALNAEFQNFKAQGITDLIVDLRYNGGGSVRTAIYLGSMITGQFNGELFSKQVWNEKVMSNINNTQFIDKFTDRITNKDNNGNVVVDEAINSLNLSKVYFIVSKNTASASELVINALSPYITVKLVGQKTYGKHVGSITLYDSDDYTKGGANFNTWHKWAMQPITFEIQNKAGANKPNGFSPQVKIVENPKNLGVLGDITEPLLERTIKYITTGARKASNATELELVDKEKWNSDMTYPDYNNMYTEFK